MRFYFSIIVFVLYVTDCYCGIIKSIPYLKVEEDNGKTREGIAEDGVNYSGGRSEVSEDVPEKPPSMCDLNGIAESLESSPSIKEKRCPRDSPRVGSIHNINSNAIVGASAPVDLQRRDLKSQMCSNCLTSASCKVLHRCGFCRNWCSPEQMAALTEAPNTLDTNAAMVGSALEGKNEVKRRTNSKISIKKRFDDTETQNLKRIYTIATLKSGLLKEVICKVLGIPDISDINTLVVWVTTNSNKPPEFPQGYKKQVTANAKRLSDELNQALNEALRKKIHQKDGHFLTNEEIEQIIGGILENAHSTPNIAINVRTTEKNSNPRSSSDEEFLPPYPIDSNDMDLNIPQIVNPGVIEDTPYINLGEEPPNNIAGFPVETRIGITKNEDSSPTNHVKSDLQGDDEKIGASTPEEHELEPEVKIDQLSTVEKPVAIKHLAQNNITPSSILNTELKKFKTNDGSENQDNKEENETLDSLIKQHKNTQQMQGSEQYYPQNNRISAVTDETIITGISPNIQNEEIIIQDRHKQNSNNNFDSAKPIQQLKQNKPQGAFQNSPHNSINHGEIDNNIIGMSENMPTDENNSHPIKQELQEIDSHKLRTDINEEPIPTSDNQEQIINSDNMEIKQTEVSSPSSTTPFARDFEGSPPFGPRLGLPPINDRVHSHMPDIETLTAEMDNTPSLAASEHGWKVVKQQPVSYRTNEDPDVIVSPNIQTIEEDTGSQVSTVEMVTPTNKLQDNDLQFLRQADTSDHNDQEEINIESELPIDLQSTTPTVNVDNFNKASAALKEVAKIVQKIQKENSMNTDSRLLGEKQPLIGIEEKEKSILEFPTVTVASVSDTLQITQQTPNAPQITTTIHSNEPEIYKKVNIALNSVPQYVRGRTQETQHAIEGQENKNVEVPMNKMSLSDNERVGSQPLENVLWDTGRRQPMYKAASQRENKYRVGSSLMENENNDAITSGVKNVEFPEESLSTRGQSSSQNIINGQQPMFTATNLRENTDQVGSNLLENESTVMNNAGTKNSEFNAEIPDLRGQSLGQNIMNRQQHIFKTPIQRENTDNVGFSPMQNENSDQSDQTSQNIISIPKEHPETTVNEFPENNQLPMKDATVLGTPQNTPNVENRGEFSGEGGDLQQSPWSNALGKFVPVEHHNEVIAAAQPKDIYFIGNGIKLPLQMVSKNDGVHLSVDLDKLCSCKNSTCPKNHTAIEATVGTILEKEAELQDQLAATNIDDIKSRDMQEVRNNNQNSGDVPLGITETKINEEVEIESPNRDVGEATLIHRNERETEDIKWLGIKNRIARDLNTNSENFPPINVEIFKRSANPKELNTNSDLKIAHDKIWSLYENSIMNNTLDTGNKKQENQQAITFPVTSEMLKEKFNADKNGLTLDKIKSMTNNSSSIRTIPYGETTPEYFKQLMDEKLTEIKSKMSDVERKNELKSKQWLLSQEKLMKTFNGMGNHADYDPTNDPKRTNGNMEDKTWEYIFKQNPTNDKTQTLANDENKKLLISPDALIYKSVIKDILERQKKRDEIFDELTPIKNTHQFKELEDFENKLEELNKYVGQYSTEGEKLIKKEARALLNTHQDAVIKQEVDIMNNILNWLRSLTVNKK